MLKLASLDPEARMQYEAREKALKDMASIRGDGLEEGIELGKAEGRKEGIELGKAEGKAEEKKEIARNLLKEGVDIELIIRASGLTKKDIEKLAAELNN